MVKKLLMAGILLSAIGVGFTGCSVEFGKMDYKDYVKEMEELDNENYEDKLYSEGEHDKEIKLERILEIKEDVSNIDGIDISLNSGMVIIQESDGNEIEVLGNGLKKDLTSNLKNKTLNIEENKIGFTLNKNIKANLIDLVKGTELQINIPKSFNKDINIKIGVGGVAIDKANIKNLKIDIGTGVIFNNKGIKLEKVDVNVGMGLTALFIEEAKNININQEIGGVCLNLKEMNGDISVKNKMGQVDIAYLNGKPYVKSEIKVGEKNMTRVEGNGKGSIYGKVNVGELSINKVSIEEFQKRQAAGFFDDFLEKIDNMESMIIENTR